jgi:predicted nucleic acid-binding protein
MDVALDANEFLSDPRMQSVRFQTLLAYLRKTQSRLLIPKIVWDEVIARYPERLSGPYSKAATDLKILRNLLLVAKIPEIAELKVDKEVAALKRKLKKPSPYVRSIILKNFSEVSIEEVVKRGIERTPPANPKGEELRDVAIWLMMLGHAKKSGRDVAYISHDEHFRENEDLHPRAQTGSMRRHAGPGSDS